MLRLVSWVVTWVVTLVTWLSLSFGCHSPITHPSLTHTLSHPCPSSLIDVASSFPLPSLPCRATPPAIISLLPPWAARLPYHHLGSEPPVSFFCPHSFVPPFALTPSLPLTPPPHRSTIPRAQTLRGKHPGNDRHTHPLDFIHTASPLDCLL
ncbi:hypothetical protein EDB80DRAFT_147765 [Ilyonectria destructans]|nr:hypothetical protein EDB80DRAFT_147765 [Ilyonectria destructans]